jgi:D-alanine-D-alanine ligase
MKRAARRVGGPGKPGTTGPVGDLEDHLRPDWWKTLFSATYLRTDGDVVESAAITSREVEVFVEVLGLDPMDRVLDLCCGQARHLIELARRGFGHLTGMDRSRYLVRLARRRARAAGARIKLHEGDARRLPFHDASFDCVSLMGNSFGYFHDPRDDISVLREVRRVLRRGGRIYLDLADGNFLRGSFEPRSWEWLDRRHLACRERALSRDGSRLVSREVVVHAGRGVVADNFYAERLYSREQVVVLLSAAGFGSVQDHGAMLAGSERNQDLGMMAKRMLISARASALQGAKSRGA